MIINGDALTELKKLPDECMDMCVTSPPYYRLRDYGVSGQIGLEEHPDIYINTLTHVFREVRRVLKPQGTLWVNICDSYNSPATGSACGKQLSNKGSLANTRSKKIINSCKRKDLIGIPWLLAFALRDDGWYLRQDIIWAKPNPMPESVVDRCTKSHEYIFLFSKSPKYYFDNEAIKEDAICDDDRKKYDGRVACGGKKHKNLAYDGQSPNTMHKRRAMGLPDIKYERRNKRDVWQIPVAPIKEAHFATFPEKLVEPCVLAGCPVGGTVLDPFFGSGTTGLVATKHNRDFIGIELNPQYVEIAKNRLSQVQLQLF